jgi:hypothetical protein
MLKLLIIAGGLVALGLYGLGFGTPSRPAVPSSAGVSPTSPLPTPSANEVSLELTDAALSDQMNARLDGQALGDTPLGPATLRHLAIEFRSGQVLTTGEAQVSGQSVPLSITSTIDLQAGKPVVAVQDARAAGVPLPEPARRSIQQAMQAQLEDTLSRRPMHIRSLTVSAGKLLVIGTPA